MFDADIPRHAQISGPGPFVRNHPWFIEVYIVLPAPWRSRVTGRTSTEAVEGQTVPWDSLEISDGVAKLSPRGERLTGDAGSEGHLTMLLNVSEGLAQDKARLRFGPATLCLSTDHRSEVKQAVASSVPDFVEKGAFLNVS